MDEDSAPHHHPVSADGGGSSGNSSSPCSPRALYGDSAPDRTKDVYRRESGERLVSQSHTHTHRRGVIVVEGVE